MNAHNETESNLSDFFGEPIDVYTAEEAIEDGYLVNTPTDLTAQAGFKWPVRLSNDVHKLCTPPKSNKIQSYTGRLWDVLNLARVAVKKAGDDRMATFRVKIGRKVEDLWAVMDTTSGPAIHIITPSEY